MAVPKGRGLGKGLDSMIPNLVGETKEKKAPVMKQEPVEKGPETMVKITKVEPNREQPRKNFDEDALQELADSIKQFGLLQPILVQDRDSYYEIIAGERRWRAAKMAGLKQVPVVIKDYSNQEIMEVALIENIQREDLNPIEEALAYQRLIKEYNLKQDEVADKVSKSRVTITNAMRLLKLDERVQKMLIDDMLSGGHARALLGVEKGDDQYNLAMEVFDKKLSVRETEKLVKAFNNPSKPAVKKLPENDFIYRDMEEQLKVAVGTKVVIKNKDKNKGKIEIEYYSHDDFERIVDLLKNK